MERHLLASGSMRLPSTANPSPSTRPALIQAPTTRTNMRRTMLLSESVHCGRQENRVIRQFVLDAYGRRQWVGALRVGHADLEDARAFFSFRPWLAPILLRRLYIGAACARAASRKLASICAEAGGSRSVLD